MQEMKNHRPIRSFTRRIGRITDRQKAALENLLPILGVTHTQEPLNYASTFGRNAPLNIEIGFGMGEALIAMASQRPEEDFLGMEVHTPGIGNLLSQADVLGLKNIRVIDFDAVEVLKHQIADHSINSVSIFFSDPWHKPKHHKRRLINESFALLLSKKLTPGGKVFLATDWANYAVNMLATFQNNHYFKNMSPTNDYCPRIDTRPLTKFEKRGQRLGHGVWDLVFENQRQQPL